MVCTRSPPRPSPGSVIYSDEELKASAAGGDDDSSSLTEKPSESGSSCTDSQVTAAVRYVRPLHVSPTYVTSMYHDIRLNANGYRWLCMYLIPYPSSTTV